MGKMSIFGEWPVISVPAEVGWLCPSWSGFSGVRSLQIFRIGRLQGHGSDTKTSAIPRHYTSSQHCDLDYAVRGVFGSPMSEDMGHTPVCL